MKLWKRIVFTLISIVWGFVSLDYLYLSYRFMVGHDQILAKYPFSIYVSILIGVILFILWFLIMGIYLSVIRHFSNAVDLLEHDPKTGQEKVHHRWFDGIVQLAFVLSGAVFRWIYLLYFVF